MTPAETFEYCCPVLLSLSALDALGVMITNKKAKIKRAREGRDSDRLIPVKKARVQHKTLNVRNTEH